MTSRQMRICGRQVCARAPGAYGQRGVPGRTGPTGWDRGGRAEQELAGGRGRRGRPQALGIEASELLTSVVGRGSLLFVPARDLPG